MSRRIPSLVYLKDLSELILVHERKYLTPLRNGQFVPSEEMDDHWKEVVLLAEEIHGLVVPQKPKRRKDESPLEGPSGNPIP